MKKKSTVKVTDVTSDQVKQFIEQFADGKIGGLYYRGVITYKRLRPPKVKNATMGDIRYVIATQRHRETEKYWYHWEATYVFDGKNWVCTEKHEQPEHKETVERLEKMEQDSAMSSREAASCGFMRMMAL